MPQSCLPFLMFQGEAESALDFYCSVIDDARLERVERYGENEPVGAAAFKAGRLIVAGQEVMIYDSPPVHSFDFTPSFSLFVECTDESELRRLAEAFAAGGDTLMPTDNYGFSRLFAWVKDRFGVSWQFNCA